MIPLAGLSQLDIHPVFVVSSPLTTHPPSGSIDLAFPFFRGSSSLQYKAPSMNVPVLVQLQEERRAVVASPLCTRRMLAV